MSHKKRLRRYALHQTTNSMRHTSYNSAILIVPPFEEHKTRDLFWCCFNFREMSQKTYFFDFVCFALIFYHGMTIQCTHATDQIMLYVWSPRFGIIFKMTPLLFLHDEETRSFTFTLSLYIAMPYFPKYTSQYTSILWDTRYLRPSKNYMFHVRVLNQNRRTCLFYFIRERL